MNNGKSRLGLGPWAASAVFIVMLHSNANAAGLITIPAPCNSATGASAGTSSNAFLRSCSAVVNGTTAAAVGSAGLLSLVQQRIQQQESCYYQSGVELNSYTSGGQCSGYSFGYPCSVNPVPMFGISSPELSTDHTGKACGGSSGKYMQVSDLVASSSCPMPVPGTTPSAGALNATQAQLQTLLSAPPYNLTASQISSMSATELNQLEQQVEKASPGLISQASSGTKLCVYANTNPPNGEIERSWARGAWIQALGYYTNQVLNEVSCSQSITMSSDPTQNQCANFANDALNQVTAIQAASSNVVSALQAQKNIADIGNCTADFAAGDNASNPGALRQSAQHLCASRSNVEAVFTQLVVCDIFQKAKIAYESQLPTYQVDPTTSIPAIGQNGMQAAFINAVAQQVQPACKQQCKSSSNKSGAMSCIQNCYQSSIAVQYQNTINSLFPLNQPNSCGTGSPGTPYTPPTNGTPSSSTSSGNTSRNTSGDSSGNPSSLPFSDSFFGFAVVAGSLQRKRKPLSRDSMRKSAPLIYLAIAFVVFGCSSAKNLPAQAALDPNNTGCPTGMGGQPANCCTSGTLISPPPSGCSTAGAGSGAIPGSNGAGIAAGSGSGAENGSATSLAGNSSATGAGTLATIGPSGGVTPTAALAAASGAGTTAATSAPSSGLSAAGNASGNGANGSGSGSGLGSAGGDVTTAAATPSASASTLPSGADTANGYSAGGGVGSAKAAGSGFLFGNGLMGNSDLIGQNGENKFGNGTNVPAMGGTDPDNYFALTNIDENIFKKVETRYRATSLNWASSSAGATSFVMPKGQPAK